MFAFSIVLNISVIFGGFSGILFSVSWNCISVFHNCIFPITVFKKYIFIQLHFI